MHLFNFCACPRRSAYKLQTGFDTGVEGKATHRYNGSHRFPTHALREFGDDHFQGDAVQAGAAGEFFSDFHVFILQGLTVYNGGL